MKSRGTLFPLMQYHNLFLYRIFTIIQRKLPESASRFALVICKSRKTTYALGREYVLSV